MIIVNELHGVSGISPWLKHFAADADAMSFPDVVFPAFLFIVGMSIPFGINNRLQKGDGFWQLQWHIIYRALGLIVMGFFMVNAEEGYNSTAMGMSIQVWSLLSYLGFMLIWGVYRFQNLMLNKGLRLLGVLIIVYLGYIYRSGVDGNGWMTPQWWGILGLIGWGYLISSMIYQLARGRLISIALAIVTCSIYYALHQYSGVKNNELLSFIFSQDGHAAHSSIVLSGMLISLIFFDTQLQKSLTQRYGLAAIACIAMLLIGYALRPYFTISKIYATPSWCMYSAAICTVVFCGLYWMIDIQKNAGWVKMIEPAAANPLITYLIPFVVEASLLTLSLSLPSILRDGAIGICYAIAYAMLVVFIVSRLNRYNFKLKL